MTYQTKADAIVAECVTQGIIQEEQIAYILATADWETNHTLDPVREAYWLSEDWRQRNLRYYPYYGRGLVQLTWEDNYRKYTEIMDDTLPEGEYLDFIDVPDRVLDPQNSRFILVHGFLHGTFTGRKLTDYINAEHCDFYNARRCINGTDKAKEIADIAEVFLAGKEWDLA